jgi:deazaflavin-dependent oxidoreductase (nitroreductase family)
VPLPRLLARFNRVMTNKVLGPLAYVPPPFALVVHRGRRSGREYRTPVWAFRTRDGVAIALTYGGSRSEWVNNVLASGRADLVTREGSHELSRPRVVHGEDGMRAMPHVIRPALRVLGVDNFLLFHIDPIDASSSPSPV